MKSDYKSRPARAAFTALSLSVALALATLASCSTGPEAQRDPKALGSGGVQFQAIPLDIDRTCSAIILRGTGLYQNVAYLMPKGYFAVDRNLSPLAEILPRGQNEFIFKIGLFYPSRASQARPRMGNSHLFDEACDLGKVRGYLASNPNALPRGNTRSQPITLAPLPVSRIKVTLKPLERVAPGSGVAYIGSETTNLLELLDRDHIVEFKIPERDTLRAFLNELSGPIGVRLDIDYEFTAQVAQETVRMKLDGKKLADAFEAEAGIAATPLTKMGEGDLQSALDRAIRKVHLDIYHEFDSDAPADELVKTLIETIIEFSRGNVLDHPPEPGYDYIYGSNNNNEAPIEPPVGRLFKVKAVTQALRTRANFEINYQKMGKREAHVYSTSMILRTGQLNPYQPTFDLVSGGEPLTPVSMLDVGQSIVVQSETYRKRALRASYREAYLSKYELGNLPDRMRHFPILERLRDKDVLSYRHANGDEEAYAWDGPTLGGSIRRPYYRWGVRTLRVDKGEDVVDTPAFEELPLGVRFHERGTRYFRPKELLAGSPSWEVDYDHEAGRIVLTAKRRLGAVSIANLDRFPVKEYRKEVFFQEKKRGRHYPGQKTGELMETFESKQPSEILKVPAEESILRIGVQIPFDGGAREDGATGVLTLQPSRSEESPRNSRSSLFLIPTMR